MKGFGPAARALALDWEIKLGCREFHSVPLKRSMQPKIDHSGRAARIVLEHNKFSKKVTSNRVETGTLGFW